MNVFVYGTLMSGLYNHKHMSGSTFIGCARTVKKYGMHVMVSIPFLHDDEELYHIQGELYTVTPTHMKYLDRIESWYKRKIIQVIVDNKTFICFAYFKNQKSTQLTHGNFRLYAEKNL